MTQAMLTSFTDAEIRRQADNTTVRDLRDARYPGVYFRFHQNRDRGTWYLVSGNKWEKIAGFPQLPVKGLIGALPKIRERLAADPKSSTAAGTLQTVGELLDWFTARQSIDRSLSAKRRSTNTSIISCHVPGCTGLTHTLTHLCSHAGRPRRRVSWISPLLVI